MKESYKIKATPKFTWFRWGIGAEKWGADDRDRCASLFRAWRRDRRFTVELLGSGSYRVTRDDC